MKTLGVVIPVYNTQKYLRQCVESVLSQNIEDMRVILVDDGSDDGSSEVCDEFALNDIRVRVIHQNNKGKLESRYIGASCLNTDYITFVDSDDWIAEDTYTGLYKYMETGIDIISYKIVRYMNENYYYKSCDMIREGVFVGDEYKKKVCSSMIWNEEKNEFGIDPSLCNKLFKRDIILPQLEMARQICVSYGDDMAVAYPSLHSANSYLAVDEYMYYHRRRPSDQIPEYFLDENFYNKLTDLYDYLRKRFMGDLDYVRQLDLFFAYSVNLRLRQYDIKKCSYQYLFPFDNIPKNSRVVLYGAGSVGESYYRQIDTLKFCEVVAWVDQNKKQNGGVHLCQCDIFNCIDFDYVVIALKSKDAAQSIRKMLEEKYHVTHEKIIWAFR